MSTEETTFSLEVRSFPTGIEDRKLRAALALACGISEPEARDLIDSAPVVVKKGADAAATKRLAGMLVKFGAEVIIRNERTGEERVHGGSPSSPREGGTPSFTSTWDETSAPQPVPNVPSASVRPPPPPGPTSVPPVASVPPSVGSLEVCGSCARAVEQGEVCTHCGWHNDAKKRFCSACKKDLVSGSDFFGAKKLLLLLIALVGSALTVGAFLFFGAYAAGAALCFVAGTTWILSSFVISFRCGSCGRKVESYSLRTDETAVLAKGRVRRIVLGAAFAVSGLGLVVPALAGVPDLFVDSFGMGWRATAPFTHREAERRVLSVATDAGSQRLTMHRRHHPRFAVETYALLHAMMPESAKLSADDARLEAFMKKVVEASVGGSLATTDVVTLDGKKGRQGTVEATEGSRKLAGKIRALVFERDVVMILFLASGEGAASNPGGVSFLDTLVTVKP